MLPVRANEGDVELKTACPIMFMGTHNTGLHANSYTTNMGVGMSECMTHLRKGIERLQDELLQEDAQLRNNAHMCGSGPTSLGLAKRAPQMRIRINTAHAKCSHVGWSELVAPMLFGHVCYHTQVLERMDESPGSGDETFWPYQASRQI